MESREFKQRKTLNIKNVNKKNPTILRPRVEFFWRFNEAIFYKFETGTRKREPRTQL